MRISLVCIGKNEDNYIQEWVEYHLKLGFDSIFLYENDWECKYSNTNLIKIRFDGKAMQLHAYCNFITYQRDNYDWAAFLDIDEFLVLKNHNNVKDFVSDYQNYEAIGINWVFFGDNGLDKVEDNNYEVLSRFTKRQIEPNPTIKSIVKICHNLEMYIHASNLPTIDTNYNIIINPPFNENGPIDVAQINHYFCKTKEEFIPKMFRGRADILENDRTIELFYRNNYNEIEDNLALNFFKNNK